MDKFLAIIDLVINFVTNIPGTAYVVIVFILEAAMRLWKTEKPKSFLLVVRKGLEYGVLLGQKLIALSNSLIAFVDKIIPQNVK